VTVHRDGCPRVAELDPERRVDVSWDNKQKIRPRPVTIRVVTAHRPGILAAISRHFSDANVNISSANCVGGEDCAVNTFSFTIGDLGQLNGIMKALRKVPGVHSVERV
jgi:GTP pyrophosphokinase